jgi:cytochrome c oxidase subunit 2
MDNVHKLLSMIVPRQWLFSVLPDAASDHANAFDVLYWFLIYSCGFLFLLVVIPLAIIVIRYHRKDVNQRALSQTDHNFWLESLWTFLPFIYLAVLFAWGFFQYLEMYVAPNDAKEIKIIGQKWQWTIEYPEEGISLSGPGVLFAVPIDTPIKMVMSSQDVIHSLFVPPYRIKQDVVPGRYSTLSFTPNKLGEFAVLCAEYCGLNHSLMLAQMKVLPQGEYNDWIAQQKNANQEMPLPELGKSLVEKLGCIACHSTDGSPKLAPSFKDVYGRKEELTDGSTVTVDENYPINNRPKKATLPLCPAFKGE